MPKPFLSFENQLFHLENNKLLNIPNREFAISKLQQIGYFSLICGYKEPFKNTTTKNYRSDITFNDIVALYELDENLRELFLRYILKIERNLRSLLSYYFTEKYGEVQSTYLTQTNFKKDTPLLDNICELIEKLDNLANTDEHYPFINHQRSTYKNVPLWVIVNALTFGSLSKFYSFLTQDLQIKIAKHFDKVNEKQLEHFLNVITKFRNVCAHNERLYSFKTKNYIPNTDVHKNLNIRLKASQYIYGKKDLFAVVISFKYLLTDYDFTDFINSLSLFIDNYLKSSQAIPIPTLLEYMGFPPNWRNIQTCSK